MQPPGLSEIIGRGTDGPRAELASLITDVSHDTEEGLEEVHELAANGTLVPIAFHVLGVVFTSTAHRENLVKAMFNGRKRPL